MSAKSIFINGEPTTLPEYVVTVKDLLKWRNIPLSGTAVAVNSRLVPASHHECTQLEPLDKVSIISAAYGG